MAARVTAGTSAAATVHLLAGATLSLLLSDPQQLLQVVKSAAQQQFRISISAPNGRRRYLVADTLTSTQRQYTLLVPVNTNLEIHIAGSGLRVGDTSGKVIDKKPILVFVPAGAQTHSLSLNLVPAP